MRRSNCQEILTSQGWHFYALWCQAPNGQKVPPFDFVHSTDALIGCAYKIKRKRRRFLFFVETV